MEYDPIKDRLGDIVRKRPFLRKFFYSGLDLLFLRTWYVQRAIRRVFSSRGYDRSSRIDVLDAGAGFGQYSYFIARRYASAHITAVDVKEDYLEDCRRFFGTVGLEDRVTFIASDLTDPASPAIVEPATYDFVLCVDVMEHIENDEQVLANFSHVLKQDGCVLINTPSDKGGSDVLEASDESFVGEHVRDGYNLDDLLTMLRSAGLEPISAEYGYGQYGSLAWRLLIKWPIQLIGKHVALSALLPLYYLPALPVGLALNKLDLETMNSTGTGITVLAQKI